MRVTGSPSISLLAATLYNSSTPNRVTHTISVLAWVHATLWGDVEIVGHRSGSRRCEDHVPSRGARSVRQSRNHCTRREPGGRTRMSNGPHGD